MANGPSVERTRRAFVPDEAWLAKQAKEPILEPDLPIVDPHHHLWDHANHRYLLDELLADTGTGHNITATVYHRMPLDVSRRRARPRCGRWARRSSSAASRR